MTMDDDNLASKRSKLSAESKAEDEISAKRFKHPLPLSPRQTERLTSSMRLSESEESTVVAGRITETDESATPSRDVTDLDEQTGSVADLGTVSDSVFSSSCAVWGTARRWNSTTFTM